MTSTSTSTNMTDSVPTTGLLEVYNVPTKAFDSDKIHFNDEFLLVRKATRINSACHGITRIIDNGNLVKRRKNLVLDQGRELIADIMAGRIPADPITKFAIGNQGYIGEIDYETAPPKPQGSDTKLNNEIFEKNIDSIEKPNMAANTYVGFIDEHDMNGSVITEWALKTNSGLVFSRATTKPTPKEADFVVVIRWTIQH